MSDLRRIVTTGGLSPPDYDDHGIGKAVVLVHGRSMDRASWTNQRATLLAAGYRVITYGRRDEEESIAGDIHTRAADLSALVDRLALHDFALVGHADGTLDIVRYFSRYGSIGVSKVAFITSTLPVLPENSAQADVSDDLGAIDVPTLVLHGEDDPVLPVEQTAIALARRIRGARLVIIEGGGHDIISTHAGRVNQELVAFLR